MNKFTSPSALTNMCHEIYRHNKRFDTAFILDRHMKSKPVANLSLSHLNTCWIRTWHRGAPYSTECLLYDCPLPHTRPTQLAMTTGHLTQTFNTVAFMVAFVYRKDEWVWLDYKYCGIVGDKLSFDILDQFSWQQIPSRRQWLDIDPTRKIDVDLWVFSVWVAIHCLVVGVHSHNKSFKGNKLYKKWMSRYVSRDTHPPLNLYRVNSPILSITCFIVM